VHSTRGFCIDIHEIFVTQFIYTDFCPKDGIRPSAISGFQNYVGFGEEKLLG
jgi:hypothetical protein